MFYVYFLFYFFRSFGAVPLRHGVVACPTPRVASENAPDGECQSLDGSVFDQCLTSILTARRCETTGGWREWGDYGLIETDGKQQHPYRSSRHSLCHSPHPWTHHSFSAMRFNSFTIFSSTTAVGKSASASHTKPTVRARPGFCSTALVSTCLFIR